MPTVYNKVTAGNQTLIDLSQDTVTSASDIVSGKVGHLADGTQVTGTGGGGVQEPEPLDVDFIDYDGTLLYTYTAADFLNLSELPANPSHAGLTAQGWNWSLTDAKAYVQEWGCLVIGQSYVTSDGKTKVYVHITKDEVDISAPLYVYLNARESGSGTIDWGDDSTATIASGTGGKSFNHVYSASGDYVVTIDITSGSFSLGYHGSNTGAFGNASNNQNTCRCLQTVKKVEIGNRITGFGRQPFRDSIDLESVSIPTTLVGFNDTASPDGSSFNSYSMKGIVFPSGFQGKAPNMFGTNPELRYVSTPKSMTKFSINSASVVPKMRKLTLYNQDVGTSSTVKLGYVRRLTHLVIPGNYETLITGTVNGSLIKKFTIPATVTTIQTEALMYSYYLEELHVLPTSVPTLSNVRALNGLGPNIVIYVPYSPDHSILEAYKTATNWSTFASYMQEEPQ